MARAMVSLYTAARRSALPRGASAALRVRVANH
jgi:hypothetical protein